MAFSRALFALPAFQSEPPALVAFGRRLRDGWVGWLERRRSYPSDRALSEFLGYYAHLYQECGPNPAAFAVLLRRNGRPFMANPFPEGNPEHYVYHPEGLAVADLEAILAGVARKWRSPSPAAQANPQGTPDWPTLEQAQVAQRLYARGMEAHWARNAGVCWGLMLLEPGSMDWLLERVHPDNLAWATVEALRHSPWKEWSVDPARVLAAAVAKGVVSHSVATALFPEWTRPVTP